MKARVILVSAVTVAATIGPMMLADAGDDIPAFMPAGTTGGTVTDPLPFATLPETPAQPLMPPGQSQSAAALLPQMPASAAQPLQPSPAGTTDNPFAIAAPAAPLAGPAVVTSNPFAIAQTRALPQSDAAPFSLGTVTATGADPARLASLGENADVTALRYYASQRDMVRVGAETRRLKSLYPGWEPPADLFVEPSTIDEQPLWDLFAEGRYLEQRALIADLQANNPGWVPSTDLTSKLEDAEARLAMRTAYSLGNWDNVIAVAQARSSVLVCSQIEALWQVGEAFARKGDYATAFETYRYVLTNCNDAGDRLSTVQKASLVLPAKGTDALVMLGQPQPDGTTEFTSIGFDELRRRLAANVNDRFEADPVMPNELERFVNFVEMNRNPDDIGLIAWFYYAQKEWEAAQAWFAMGNKVKRDAKFIEGLILATRAAGDSEEAFEMAAEFRDRAPELAQQYIELVAEILADPLTTLDFPKRDLRDFEELVEDRESALGAQAIGWRYIEEDSLNRASDWFERSMDWEVTEGGVIGQAVIASRKKHYKTLAALKADYGDEYAELDDFKVYTSKVRKARSVSVRSQKPTSAAFCERNKSGRGLLTRFLCGKS